MDATTIQLVASCMDWAKHRRRKAAAKCHLWLNLQCLLPSFALIDTAKHHDNKRAREFCAGLRAGESVLFDKAYVAFAHHFDLLRRGIFWVTRAKDNLQCRLADRSFLQATQADLAVSRLPGAARPCGALAGLAGVAGVGACASSPVGVNGNIAARDAGRWGAPADGGS